MLYAARGQDFRSCCSNAANFPAVKISPAGACTAARSPNFSLIFNNPPRLSVVSPENLTLLTDDGATTYSSLQPGGDSWSLLRARFDPWLVSQAEGEGVQCVTGATVTALHRENGRVCGVICDNETLRARYVVLAEGANSELAERHGLLPRPSPTAMALGIKAVLAMERKTLEDRFRLEGSEGRR